MPVPPSGYPIAHVEFEGQAVPPDAVRSLELETNVGYLADALTLVLDNAALYSDFLRKEQPVEAWLGYVADPRRWDKGELAHIFSGGVDGVLPAFGTDRTLEVRARDHTRRLIDSQADPGWAFAGLNDSGVVRMLAVQAGLRANVVESSVPISQEEERAFLGGGYLGNPQVGMSGWDIVQTLAVRNGYIAYVTPDKELYWGPRLGALPVVGGVLAGAADAPVGTWTYLAEPFDLLAAQFDDSSLIVNKVTVARWVGIDAATPDGFVSGSYVDAGRLKAARGRLIEKTVVSSRANGVPECEAEAAAISRSITGGAITARATLEGSPLLRGDVRVRLAGAALGRFAGDYFLESCTHRLDADGYGCEARLSSVRPEAQEVYRPSLQVLDPDHAAALAPDGPTPAQPGPCGEGPPVDYAAEWPEFGGPVAGLLVANGIATAIATEDSTCGPIAAAGMLKAFGIPTDPGKLAARAYRGDADGKWWTGGGMAGPASEVKLIESQGLKVRDLGRDLTSAVARASSCQPVIFDLAGAHGNVGHYVLASAYRASDGRFFGGVTISNAMKASHGNPWATVAELESYGLGSIRSVIIADAPLPAQGPQVSQTGGAITPAAYPLHAVPAGLINAAPKRLRDAIKQSGRWPEAEWDAAAAIGFNETGGSWKEDAHKDDAIEDSRGVFQVNVRPNANPQYAAWDLFDYDRCAQAAYEIWSGSGNSWRRWSTAAGLGLS